MQYIGKFYGMMLFKHDDGTYQIELYTDRYDSLEEAKTQIRKWKNPNYKGKFTCVTSE